MPIDTKAHIALDNIDKRVPKELVVDGKHYAISMMNNAVAERFDRYIAKAEVQYSKDQGLLFLNMSNNRKLVPKCVSLLLLHSWFKVKFFHWWHWRMLHITKTQAHLGKILEEGLSLGESNILLKNLLYLQDNCKMIRMMSETNIRSMIAEQKSEQETTPS